MSERISRDDVAKVAHLARLRLTDDELATYTSQLDAILERFQAPGAAREVVQETARLLAAGSMPDSLLGVEGVSTEARLAARWLQPEQQAELQRALRRWERTRPWLNAEQLVAMGVPRGPALGAALRGLRRGRYLGTLRTIAEARRHVRRVLASEAHWDFDEPLD